MRNMDGSKPPAHGFGLSTNPGVPFDERRVKNLSLRAERLAEKESLLTSWKGPSRGGLVPSLVRILCALDLTTLSGDDTVARVKALCRRAQAPLPRGFLALLGGAALRPRVAAVCVFPAFVPSAITALGASGVRVATVAAGFPHGLSGLEERVQEVRAAVALGAQEVDVVIRREWALSGKWERLHQEVREFREAAGSACLKVILATGELGEPNRIARAALTVLQAGADFVKTSTGKEKVNATLTAGLAMTAAIRAYEDLAGFRAGLKPAGGIRTAQDGLLWLRLVETEMGPEATGPDRFRIGASGLLDSLVERMERAPVRDQGP
ncbi:deoxyribose-phosphate aldolase [Gemmatimonadota bacterium]